ncbi:ATP-binding cassette domain-containing protein [Micromonospora sp. NPDC003776]
MHALVGENGAGKSTLIKIVSGAALFQAAHGQAAPTQLGLTQTRLSSGWWASATAAARSHSSGSVTSAGRSARSVLASDMCVVPPLRAAPPFPVRRRAKPPAHDFFATRGPAGPRHRLSGWRGTTTCTRTTRSPGCCGRSSSCCAATA